MSPFERIRRDVYRDGRMLTVQEMAAAVGVSYGAWYNAEQGYVEEPIGLIAQLATLNPDKFDEDALLAEYVAWRDAHLAETREAIRAS